ncbi:hypothetical protein BTA34_12515 [Proteus sp. CD3]|nr:hypothetical protein BTA34_12515 [Proteus sp. CD3]
MILKNLFLNIETTLRPFKPFLRPLEAILRPQNKLTAYLAGRKKSLRPLKLKSETTKNNLFNPYLSN